MELLTRVPSNMPRSIEQRKVGFLGGGRMATALAKGLISRQFTAADHVIASDPSQPARGAFTAETGARATTSNIEVLRASDIVVLAVKPQHVADVLSDMR